MCFARILTAPVFSTFLCSLAALLNAFMVFILVVVGKHTDFSRDFQQIEAFGVMDSGVLISAIKILCLLSQFRSPLISKQFCSAFQLCCLSAFQVSSDDAVTSGYQLSRYIYCLISSPLPCRGQLSVQLAPSISRENCCGFRKG